MAQFRGAPLLNELDQALDGVLAGTGLANGLIDAGNDLLKVQEFTTVLWGVVQKWTLGKGIECCGVLCAAVGNCGWVGEGINGHFVGD